MHGILKDRRIADGVGVAIEFQIPMTSKRVDFIIAGSNEKDETNVLVVELKQWEEAFATQQHGIVKTFLGGNLRSVAHPSYQAYSYAKTIENFNADVQDKNIPIQPCAFLHNYKAAKRDEIINSFYRDIIEDAPVFLMSDKVKFADFITRYTLRKMRNGINQSSNVFAVSFIDYLYSLFLKPIYYKSQIVTSSFFAFCLLSLFPFHYQFA